MQTPSPSSGYCAGCGYCLRGLTLEPRCPECGRKFDPDDPKTFRRHPHGRLVRWLAEPIGWPTVILSLLSAAGVLTVSRWQWNTFNPSAVDLVYYLNPSALRHGDNLYTYRDYVFTGSMLLAIFVAAWWVLRLVFGMLARWRMDWQCDELPIRAGRRHALIFLALLLVGAGAALGWPYRFAQQWIALRYNDPPFPVNGPRMVVPRMTLSGPQAFVTLRAAVIQLAKAKQRTTGLRILVEEHPEWALPILIEAVGFEPDSQLRALELRLIGLHRDKTTVSLLCGFMSHPDAFTRAAAADAIGLVHAPAFDVPLRSANPYFHENATTVSAPQINLGILPSLIGPKYLSMDVIEIDSKLRDGIEHMMLAGETSEEREAAARALLRWPPDSYELRVAEWGVWVNDGGHLKLVQSTLDEIPPFVHRTGDRISDFNNRVDQTGPWQVAKPIVQITVDKPMSLEGV